MKQTEIVYNKKDIVHGMKGGNYSRRVSWPKCIYNDVPWVGVFVHQYNRAEFANEPIHVKTNAARELFVRHLLLRLISVNPVYKSSLLDDLTQVCVHTSHLLVDIFSNAYPRITVPTECNIVKMREGVMITGDLWRVVLTKIIYPFITYRYPIIFNV